MRCARWIIVVRHRRPAFRFRAKSSSVSRRGRSPLPPLAASIRKRIRRRRNRLLSLPRWRRLANVDSWTYYCDGVAGSVAAYWLADTATDSCRRALSRRNKSLAGSTNYGAVTK